MSEATTERRPRPSDDADDAVTTAPAPGRVVVRGALAFARDRYETGRLLGEGGMGEVISARDRDLGREVAMKLVRAGKDSEANVLRFLREARVQAQLEHPSIVPVYEVGHDLGNRPFFTMRRVQGVTLDTVLDRLRSGNDPAAEREYTRARLLELFTEVVLAVDFSHSRGILHRDLKPSNVMFGDFGEVYVLDWGVAKIAAATVSSDAEGVETAIGTAVGTPAYMAPEQALGLPVDQRADVFTLGALLFEILALEPFVRDGDVDARMRDPTLEIDPKPSHRAPDRKIPPELDAICETALQTNPSLRYLSARELYEAVEAYLSGDREEQHRQELAKNLLERARSATERVLSGKAEDSRKEALAAIGRAIAILPEDDEPLRLLHQLLARPPSKLPPDLEGRVAQEGLTRFRKTLPGLAIAYSLPWVTVYPFVAFLGGIRHATAILPVVFWLLAGLVMMLDYRRRTRIAERTGSGPVPHASAVPAITLLSAIAVTTVVAGPFFLLPPLALATAKGLVLAGFRIRTRWVVVTGTLAVLVPTALAWFGLHPIYGWHDGALVFDGAIGFSPKVFCIVVTLVNVTVLLGASLFASSYRDTLDVVEMKNLLMTWRLSQLVGANRGNEDGG